VDGATVTYVRGTWFFHHSNALQHVSRFPIDATQKQPFADRKQLRGTIDPVTTSLDRSGRGPS